jgi:alkylation response protein AidB-like acyl-CoA dehydrogenase
LEEAWEVVCEGATPEPSLQARLRGAATYTTEVAADIISGCFRFGGGEALHESSVLQRCLRDISAGAQHQMVSDIAYENHGRFLLGLPDATVM